MDETTKLMTPEARVRRDRLVGSPVKFTDGHEWLVPAMPVGPVGDPLATLGDKLASLEGELQIAEARQQNELQAAMGDVLDAETEAAALKTYRTAQERIRELESKLRRTQLSFVALALMLNYGVKEEEVAEITTLRQVRQVTQIVAGAPQMDEVEEAMRALKGGSGN